MKKLLICLFYLGTLTTCLAQTFAQKQHPSISIGFTFHDFNTAQYLKSNSLSNSFRNKEFAKFKNLKPGVAVSYLEGLTKSIDLQLNAGGTFIDYPIKGRAAFGENNFLFEVDGTLRLKLFSNKYWLSPFIQTGVGFSNYRTYYGIFLPAGVGVQANVSKDFSIVANTQYRISASTNTTDHLLYGIAVVGKISNKRNKKSTSTAKKEIRNTIKNIDQSSNISLLTDSAVVNQLSDIDGDGIFDIDDKCPTTKGFFKYQGCPVPDTDSDGINDEQDQCPQIKGVIRYLGCPVPDKDKDGVGDEEDKCPEVVGLKESEGCPPVKEEIRKKINFVAQNILFENGSFKLRSSSFKVLDTLVAILREDIQLKINVEGHTDEVGDEDDNKQLSEQRAKSVVVYLERMGIRAERMSFEGFGESKPVDTNSTATGRANNRRVEIKVNY